MPENESPKATTEPRMMWERYRISGKKHDTTGRWGWRQVPLSGSLKKIVERQS